MIKKIFAISALLVALAGCKSEPRLVIIHTNDTHSHFEPLRTGPQAGQGGVIERAAVVDSIRNV